MPGAIEIAGKRETLGTSPRRLRYHTLGLAKISRVEAGLDLVSCQCFFWGERDPHSGLIIISSYYPGLGWGRGRKCTTFQKSHRKAFRGSTVKLIFVSTVSVKKKKKKIRITTSEKAGWIENTCLGSD